MAHSLKSISSYRSTKSLSVGDIDLTSSPLVSPFRRKYGFEIYGKDGLDLFDYWEKGMRTFHGHSIHNFPNFFIAGWTQVGASWNFCNVAAAITEHVAQIVAETRKAGPEAVIEATAEGEKEWVDIIRSSAGFNDEFLESCTPGYYNNEGKFRETVATFPYDQYAPGLKAFQVVLGDWWSTGKMEGMTITK